MTYGEALRLVRLLREDPSSQIAAACEGWAFPATREHMAILDLFDVTVLANSDPKKGRPKPHGGRPMKVTGALTKRPTRAAGITDQQVLDALIRAGHKPPV